MKLTQPSRLFHPRRARDPARGRERRCRRRQARSRHHLQDLASITAAIGGDRVDVFALAKGYQDPHFVDAKPSFVLQLRGPIS